MQSPRRVRFGPFEADLWTGELRKDDLRIKLQEQPAKILAALLEHPGEVVTREDFVRLLWPDGTFVDYDRGLNAAVNRLRQTLRDSAESPRYIETVARRGYRFIAPAEAEETGAPEQPGQVRASRSRYAILAVAILLAVAGIALVGPKREFSPAVDPAPLTTYPGTEGHPSFSPDGTQVVFSWNGEEQRNQPAQGGVLHDNFDLYITVLGAGSPAKLTDHPAAEVFPAWSPDGRQIAFVRTGQGIFLIPPVGGAERKLFEWHFVAGQLSWSPDSKYLATARGAPQNPLSSSIVRIDMRTHEAQEMLPRAEGFNDLTPAFSPDGRLLAFARCRHPDSCTLSVADVDGASGVAKGVRSVVGPSFGFISSIAWTPDGDGLVYSQEGVLRRVPLRGGARAQSLAFVGPHSTDCVAVSRAGSRLAYSDRDWDPDLWAIEDGVLHRSPLSSTRIDHSPQFSPDGSKVAFCSTRSGNPEIWITKRDGSGAMQLTSSRASESPQWSPDGQSIVYSSQSADGRWDIYVIDAQGAAPRSVVRHEADDRMPSFSRNGKWIYFSSDRGGGYDIYRVPATGGEPVKLSEHGGFTALESEDGKSIYYTTQFGFCVPLVVRPVDRGPERRVIDSVCSRAFAVTARGIYHTSYDKVGREYVVALFDTAAGKSSVVGRMERLPYLVRGLAVSPDGKTILVAASTRVGSDLHLVENFR